jgi:hypothetical protein
MLLETVIYLDLSHLYDRLLRAMARPPYNRYVIRNHDAQEGTCIC